MHSNQINNGDITSSIKTITSSKSALDNDKLFEIINQFFVDFTGSYSEKFAEWGKHDKTCIVDVLTKRFKECSSKQHRFTKSPYLKEHVPFESFKCKNGKFLKTCNDCCDRKKMAHKKVREKAVKEQKKLAEDENFRFCIALRHATHSKHPKNKVPIELFKQDESDELFITCFDCREHKKKLSLDAKEFIQSERKKLENDPDFRCCSSEKHCSVYPINKVPIKLFLGDPDNPKSFLFKNCIDCRTIASTRSKNLRQKMRDIAKKKGLTFCEGICKKMLSDSERAKNLDGTLSSKCPDCKNNDNQRRLNLKKVYLQIKHEFLTKNECSCERCKTIFLKPSDSSSLIVGELETFEKDGKMHVEHLGVEYLATFFMEENRDLIELGILQFDHLTEQEQRERGLLLQNEPFVEKQFCLS